MVTDVQVELDGDTMVTTSAETYVSAWKGKDAREGNSNSSKGEAHD